MQGPVRRAWDFVRTRSSRLADPAYLDALRLPDPRGIPGLRTTYQTTYALRDRLNRVLLRLGFPADWFLVPLAAFIGAVAGVAAFGYGWCGTARGCSSAASPARCTRWRAWQPVVEVKSRRLYPLWRGQ